MCVEFTNLNIAFPKYPYPIANIDHLIDISFGYKTLSFMDAYYGYNKINHVDMPKTKFMSNHDIYYYNVMSFSINNAGSTYQSLMDKKPT